MDVLIEFGQIILPAGLVLYAMYLVVRSFIDKEIEKTKLEVRGRSIETVLPNRLQAYERMVLFLERMSPQSLLLRLDNGSFSAGEFHHILLNEIRNEYNHNVSQQVYMSDEAWELIKTAKEDLILTINEAAMEMEEKSRSIELGRKIMDKSMAKNPDPIAHALLQVKNEIRQTF
ncbi:MAG: hypothetical protein OEY51_11670 [Cyclobacteriaceae bacterium]|nr:hypothetical protein [Cyclobacteriaceae bacterium]